MTVASTARQTWEQLWQWKNLWLSLNASEWLITPNTMQKFVFSFENKRKLRPDCMIVEITNDEIDRALRKRTRNGDTNIPTQINSRPRKIWLIELGYSFDTRYMDKVTEKKE
jgi:hypothetical protein